MNRIIGVSIFVLFTLLISSCTEDATKVESYEYKEVDYSSIQVNKIEFIEFEDISVRIIGDNDLSELTDSQLAQVPINKRINCRLAVTSDFNAGELEIVINDFINKIVSIDQDIDELNIYLYSDKSLFNGAYDIAMATWLPRTGEVNGDIAKSNSRSNYEIKITARENLKEFLLQRNIEEEKFGISHDDRKNIYSELVRAEMRAREDADKMFPANTSVEKNVEKNTELLKKYKMEIRKKYKISEDIEWEIIDEGLKKGWAK